MPEITQNIKLEQLDSGPQWLRAKNGLSGFVYTFQVNPNKLDITDEVQVVESQFLRQDGGIVRPTQVKLRKISGSGKFMDVPEGSEDSFPLVAKGTKHSAFDAYQDLVSFMKTRQIMRMSHQYIGEIYVIIQNLSISNTPSPNTIDFTFSFIETMVDSGRTGFERDKNQQTPGMAVSSKTSQSDQIQYDTYTVVSGDTLSKIALKFYGSASKWGTIADYNTSILTLGPNVLKIGWVLRIPKSSSAPYKRSGGVTPQTKYTPDGQAVGGAQDLGFTGTATIFGDNLAAKTGAYVTTQYISGYIKTTTPSSIAGWIVQKAPSLSGGLIPTNTLQNALNKIIPTKPKVFGPTQPSLQYPEWLGPQ